MVGTAAYLSPEQARGEEATPASDVYALGVVLYQFLTGRLPYEGSSLAELAVRQQNESPLPPSTYDAEVPEALGAAVLRALEGDPLRRYSSAAELADGLERGLAGAGRRPCPWPTTTRRPACSAARRRPGRWAAPRRPAQAEPTGAAAAPPAQLPAARAPLRQSPASARPSARFMRAVMALRSPWS